MSWIGCEHHHLIAQKRGRRKTLKDKMDQFWRIEEIKVRQRVREKNIKEGDKNTLFCKS
jgi:hypothetical protein